ncbi:hypothetical protein AVEN_105480-1 [Araneus ventricosus]|uniref:Uncharacterized protein n=1 Tax=Araneus ventricosus TaxID=182803 RepID=A0A4Y2GLF3_ARAVE|nr:hypothetical protein AVEN_105480-1 [Araneus ventricosus]
MVGGDAGPEYLPLSYEQKKSGPFSGQRIDSSSKRNSFPTFFVIGRISTKNETFDGVSPFLDEKGITSCVGEVKSTKKLRSGDLLVEVESPKQAKEISKMKSLSTIPVTGKPHAILNSSKGVISCEARKLVKSQTPTLGNSYVSVAKKSISAPSADRNKDICTVSISKSSDSTTRASPPITNSLISSSPSVAPVNEEASASPDFTDFKPVSNRKKLKKNSPTKTNNTIAEKVSRIYTTSHLEVPNSITTKDDISTHQSALKPSVISKPTSVDIELLPMAVLPPLEKRILQSRESDADAEMSSSSASEDDALEFNMSEDLEDSPAVIRPPPSSKPEMANKFKNR